MAFGDWLKMFKVFESLRLTKMNFLIIESSLETVFTDSFGEKSDFINPEIGFHTFWKRDVFFAGGLLADFAVEMEMPVFVRFFVAIVVAQFVFCGGVFLNAVDDSFFFEGF